MKIKSIVLSIVTLCFATTVFAELKHTLNCKVGPEDKQKSMYFEIEDSKLSTRLGKVTLSDWVVDANNNTAFWKPFQQAQVMAEILWTDNELSSQKIISSIRLNMGKTGFIAVSATNNIDKYNSMHTELRSNVMFFNFPNGTVTDCYYFLAAGPKPGLTGSN